MDASEGEFERIVTAVLSRFCAQTSLAVQPEHLSRIATQLAILVAERGLPCPLSDHEIGAPGSMTEQECSPLVERVMNGLDNRELGEAVRQLVKACFYPEFKVCRDSFRELTRDGSCRRQQLDRAIKRVSGTHCVDCPHWTALAPAVHVDYLKDEWRGDRDEFADHRDIFLPEDFRVLRLWLHAAARKARW
jgi:hypothetical protein